jgi:hypothetical protein
VTRAQLNIIALRGSAAHYSAYLVALDLRRGDYENAGAVIDSFRKKNLTRFLKLVADALKNGFQPTDTRRRLIEAHDAAWLVAVKKCVVRGRISVSDIKPPTLQQWKAQFKQLFPNARLPADPTFSRAAKELSLLCSASIGRPLGSKDQAPRKRRRMRLKSLTKKAVQG